MIATSIDYGDLSDCAKDYAGGFIDAINSGNLINVLILRFQMMQRMHLLLFLSIMAIQQILMRMLQVDILMLSMLEY